MLAEGASYTACQEVLGCDARYMSRWKKRFEAEGSRRRVQQTSKALARKSGVSSLLSSDRSVGGRSRILDLWLLARIRRLVPRLVRTRQTNPDKSRRM